MVWPTGQGADGGCFDGPTGIYLVNTNTSEYEILTSKARGSILDPEAPSERMGEVQ